MARSHAWTSGRRHAATRCLWWIVHRPQQLGGSLDEDQRFPLVEGVIAERDDIGARIAQAPIDVFRDAEAMGGVFAIKDHEIRPVALS